MIIDRWVSGRLDATPRLPRHVRAVPRLWADRRGSIAVLAAVSLLMLMAVAALSIDGASLYLAKLKNQEIADQAATAAAFAYVQSSNSASLAQAGASSFAVANGAGAATVTASMVASPLGDGMTAAMVTVTSTVTLRFAPAIGINTAKVSAVSYAELHAGTPCIIGLIRGVTFSGNQGLNITVSGCDIGSNANVVVQNNASVTAKAVYSTTAITMNTGGTITTSPTPNQIFPNSSAQSDPYAGHGVFNGLAVVTALTTPSFPSVGSAPSGGSGVAGSGTSCTIAPGTYTSIAASCTSVSFTGGSQPTNITGAFVKSANLTVSFSAGTYNFAGGFGISGSATVTMSFSGTSTLNIWNGLSLGGSAKLGVTSSGATTYDVQGGIKSNSSKALTFSNSGSGTSTFNVAGGVAILNGSGTFPDGNYMITSGDSAQGAGIDVDGSATASFGNGNFDVGNGIYVGSGTLTIGSGSSSSSVFLIPSTASTGNSNALDVENGATFTIGAFEYVEINGPVELDGAASLGGGTYYVEGTFHVGWSGTASSTINATGVSIIASGCINFGGVNLPGGSCAGTGSVSTLTVINLSAPAVITSATDGLPETIVLGSQAGVFLEWGSTAAQIVGTVYAPVAGTRVELGSGSVIQNSGCLMMVSDYVVINSSSAMGTTCPNLIATPATTSVTLIQ